MESANMKGEEIEPLTFHVPAEQNTYSVARLRNERQRRDERLFGCLCRRLGVESGYVVNAPVT